MNLFFLRQQTPHPAPLPWACLSDFCSIFPISLVQLQLQWAPLCCLCPSWWGVSWFFYLVPLAHLWLRHDAVSVCPGWGGGCCWYLVPLTHLRLCCFCSFWLGGKVLWPGPPRAPWLCHGPRFARKIQLTPQIPTQISSVRYPATDLRFSRHDLWCNSNTTAQPIQIE